MASASTSAVLSTNDLRSHSVDYKRDHEQKHKWQYGQAKGPGRGEDAHGAPVKPNIAARAFYKKEVSFGQRKKEKHTFKGVHNKLVEDDLELTESSADEDVEAPSAAPEPDAEITYSYDAPRGPSHGSQVLNSALAKAVEKFENRVTDKLVKDEYEVLDYEGEALTPKGKKMKDPAKAPVLLSPRDEIEYEFV